MKKLFTLLFIVCTLQTAFSQTFTEKKIVELSNLKKLDIYTFKADPVTGAYLYGDYDTATSQYTIYTNKGTTGPYNYLSTWQSIFDKEGNVYYVTYNNVTDSTYTYYLFKNNEKVGTFDYINERWVERDGIIYFAAREKDKNLLVSYNMNDGKLSRGKPYDELIPCYIKPNTGGEGEPEGEGSLAFTNDGKIYYIAASGDEKFLVLGDVEQKHYSDIDWYTFTQDKNGTFTYIARDIGKFYIPKGNTFVVQGDKEYKKYDYVYSPILFDANNNPIYTAGDSGGFNYPQRIVTGDREEKTYDGGIYDVKFTPSGKLAYIASTVKNTAERTYESFVVIDGKEGKKYSSVFYLSFPSGDEPLYAAYRKENECYIVKGNKTEEYSYATVLELRTLPTGKILCVGENYGDYSKKISDKFYVNIGDEELGPFDGVNVSDYMTGQYVQTDNAGNYAFITQRIINFDKYLYGYKVVTNKGESKEHEFIENLFIYNGKPVYTVSDKYNEKTGYSENRVYYGNKSVGAAYDSIYDFKFDKNTGKATFLTSKANSFYIVEMKF